MLQTALSPCSNPRNIQVRLNCASLPETCSALWAVIMTCFRRRLWEDYFQEVYWWRGEGLGDEFLRKFKADGNGTSFSFREVGETFRLIQSGLEPVIVAREEEARKAVRDLAYAERLSGVARRLQPYTVQVYPRFREQLVKNNHVYFEAYERFGAQFAILFTQSLYQEDVGLLWEDADMLRR